jgi:hypothetical protein
MPLSMSEAFEEAMRLSRLIDDGIDALKRHSVALAEAEQAYRLGKAKAWMRAKVELDKGTVPEREAWVNGETAALRYKRDIEDGMRQSALEAVRSRRTQVSALQSLLAAEREGAAFARTGPGMAA